MDGKLNLAHGDFGTRSQMSLYRDNTENAKCKDTFAIQHQFRGISDLLVNSQVPTWPGGGASQGMDSLEGPDALCTLHNVLGSAGLSQN